MGKDALYCIPYPDRQGKACGFYKMNIPLSADSLEFPYAFSPYRQLSFSYRQECNRIILTAHADSSFQQFYWYSGRDSAQGQVASFHFTDTGVYVVRLKAVDRQGLSRMYMDTIHYNGQPLAAFSLSDSIACAWHPVHFINHSSSKNNSPMHYVWYFGDDDTGTALNPTHIYSDSGHYTITLVTMQGDCKDSATQPISIKAAPQPGLTLSAYGGCVPFSIRYTDASHGSVKQYIYTNVIAFILQMAYLLLSSPVITLSDNCCWEQMAALPVIVPK